MLPWAQMWCLTYGQVKGTSTEEVPLSFDLKDEISSIKQNADVDHHYYLSNFLHFRSQK